MTMGPTDSEDGPDAAGGRQPRTEPESPPATPRWVLVLGLVALMLVVAFAIVMIAGGHDPSRFVH